MEISNDANNIVFDSTPPRLPVSLKNPIYYLIAFIISLIIFYGVNSEQNLSLFLLPFIFLCLVILIFILSSGYNYLVKHYSVTALIDKDNNMLTIIQHGIYSDNKTTLEINTIKKIESYGARFYYGKTFGLERGYSWNESITSRCGIYFYLRSGERVTINSYSASYTGVYRDVAEKIGQALNIPISK
jgi:energy-coupling factor transporter transmembrane protein EcfT